MTVEGISLITATNYGQRACFIYLQNTALHLLKPIIYIRRLIISSLIKHFIVISNPTMRSLNTPQFS